MSPDIRWPATGYADQLAATLTEHYGGFPITGDAVREAAEAIEEQPDADDMDRRRLFGRIDGARFALAAATGDTRRLAAAEDPVFASGHDRDVLALLESAARDVRAAQALLEQADRWIPDPDGVTLYETRPGRG